METHITDQKLLEELEKDRPDNCAVDSACVKRLEKLADDYGQDGRYALDLLKMVRGMLDIG